MGKYFLKMVNEINKIKENVLDSFIIQYWILRDIEGYKC